MLKIIESKYRSEELWDVYEKEEKKVSSEKLKTVSGISLIFKNIVPVMFSIVAAFILWKETKEIPLGLRPIVILGPAAIIATLFYVLFNSVPIIETLITKFFKKRGYVLRNPAAPLSFFSKTLHAGEEIAKILDEGKWFYEYHDGVFTAYEPNHLELIVRQKVSILFSYRITEKTQDTLDFSCYDEEIRKILERLNRKESA